MAKRLRKTETLFLSTDKKWFVSVPTEVGFRHIPLGTLNSLPTRAAAVRRALEVLS